MAPATPSGVAGSLSNQSQGVPFLARAFLLDRYGNAVHNMYIRRVERRDGRLQNVVIHTFEGVSQFWNYPEDEFLKQPPYSRNFPACKHC